jgi:hypothetical protein
MNIQMNELYGIGICDTLCMQNTISQPTTCDKRVFVCGCCNLGEALMHIAEGAAMIQTKREADTEMLLKH